jgi:hypothetical protein
MTSPDIPRIGETSYSPPAKSTAMLHRKEGSEAEAGQSDSLVLQEAGPQPEKLMPQNPCYEGISGFEKTPAYYSEALQETSSLPFLIKVGAGAMLGLTLFTSIASALPGQGAPKPLPDNGTAITRVIEEPEVEYRDPQGASMPDLSAIRSGQRTFPASLRLERGETIGLVKPEPLQMGIRHYENIELLDGLRLEIARETYTLKKNAGGTSEVEIRQKALSSLGVDVGNGLFYDLNGNLTFNPLRFQEDYSTISIMPQNFLNTTTIERDGDLINIMPRSSPIQGRTKIRTGEGKLTVNYPGEIKPTIILQQEGRTLIQAPGQLGLLNTTYITEKGNLVRIDPPEGAGSTFIRTAENEQGEKETRILAPGITQEIVITGSGDSSRIKYQDSGNDTLITRSGDKTIIQPSALGETITITRDGNKITVNHFGWKKDVSITIKK